MNAVRNQNEPLEGKELEKLMEKSEKKAVIYFSSDDFCDSEYTCKLFYGVERTTALMKNFTDKLAKSKRSLARLQDNKENAKKKRELQRRIWLLTGKLDRKYCWHGLSKVNTIYERLDMVPNGY